MPGAAGQQFVQVSRGEFPVKWCSRDVVALLASLIQPACAACLALALMLWYKCSLQDEEVIVFMPTIRQALMASITRLYPFYSGCGWLPDHRFFQLLAGSSNEVAWARVQGGYFVTAALDDYVGRAVFYTGDLDPKVTWVCSRLVRPGDTVLDIGANCGIVSFIVSAIVGPSGHVHAFEPNPYMQSLINQAILRNRVSNIQLHPIALGSRTGEAMLSIPRGNVGAASMVAARHRSESVDIPVQVRTLSSVMAEKNLDRIRLVKIDVEGFEPEVITGAIDLFSRVPPNAIIFELNDVEGDVGDHPTIRLLSSAGYGFFSLPKRLLRMRAHRFDPANPPDARGTAMLSRRSRKPGQVGTWAPDFVAAPLGPIYEEVAGLLGAASARTCLKPIPAAGRESYAKRSLKK